MDLIRRDYNVIGLSFSETGGTKNLFIIKKHIVFMNLFNYVNPRKETLLAFEVESTCEWLHIAKNGRLAPSC